MKTSYWNIFALILFLLVLDAGSNPVSGQDEKQYKILKNNVKVNLTNPMIFGDQCFMIGYERTIGDHQSFSVNIGRFSLPKVFNINTDSLTEVEKDTYSKGFHMSGDYRFYLRKENRHNSPRGVYIGPYATYNSFTRNYTMESIAQSSEGEIKTDFSFRVASIGFQLGYQFIFWNRVSLDMMLFGPGIAAYKFKANLETTLDPDEESELFQKINDALAEKIPGYDLVLKPGSFETTGSRSTTSLGYRYVVMLGIRL